MPKDDGNSVVWIVLLIICATSFGDSGADVVKVWMRVDLFRCSNVLREPTTGQFLLRSFGRSTEVVADSLPDSLADQA